MCQVHKGVLTLHKTFFYLEIMAKPKKESGAAQILVEIQGFNGLFLSISLEGLIKCLPNLVD